MRKYIDFSIEKKRLVKKLCLTKTYGSKLKMNQMILILAILALFSDFVAGEYSGISINFSLNIAEKNLKRKIYFFFHF
jgi:hypothetical protein